ncbi:MAG: nitroreductase family protein, partial [Hydrogenoanaerobacterium sp.]
VSISDELRRSMELVQRAPTTRNLQKASFMLKDGVITAGVPDDYHLDMVDLGICKLHFECGMGGKFDLGNGGKLCL